MSSEQRCVRAMVGFAKLCDTLDLLEFVELHCGDEDDLEYIAQGYLDLSCKGRGAIAALLGDPSTNVDADTLEEVAHVLGGVHPELDDLLQAAAERFAMQPTGTERVQYYNLRDPNAGDEERSRFEADSRRDDVVAAYDDSGPCEGQSPQWPRSAGLGTIVFRKGGYRGVERTHHS